MKKSIFTLVMLVAAMAFADQSSLRPESSVPTPAEKSEVSRETPNLSAKDSEEWQKMRAERREARRQILSDLRNSSAAEKQTIRQNVAETRNEKARVQGEFSEKMQPRDRETTVNEWQDPHGQFGPPPPHQWNPGPVPNPGWGDHYH